MSQTEILNDRSEQPSVLRQVVQAITSLVIPIHKELITTLRTPTPLKVSKTFLVDVNGCIGHGLDTPDPEELYRCPMSAEAWVHRISITVPNHGPAQPLTAGEIMCYGSTAGEVIFFLPYHGDIAPIQIIEGRLSAPHLNAGELMYIVGDQLTPGISIRIDLQIVLNQGVSEYTPRKMSPTDLDQITTGVPGL